MRDQVLENPLILLGEARHAELDPERGEPDEAEAGGKDFEAATSRDRNSAGPQPESTKVGHANSLSTITNRRSGEGTPLEGAESVAREVTASHQKACPMLT